MAAPSPSIATASPQERHRLLSWAARRVASAEGFDEALRQVIEACLPGLADFGFFDVVVGDEVRRTVAAHEAPDILALLAPTRWVRQEHPELNLCALSTGEAGLHADTSPAFYRRIAAGDEHLRLLGELGFRSMVTVPMRYRGELLGALTLFMGRSGRNHGPEDLELAAELADLAAPLVANARLLDRHQRSESALRRSEEWLRLAVDAGQVGIWDWDVVTGEVTWSERICELHGLPPGTDPGGVEGFRALVLDEDRPRVEAAIQEAMEGGTPYSVEFRTPLPAGGVRWIATRGHVVRDGSGRPLRMVGASTDVTERVELLAAERHARGEAEAARHRVEALAAAGAALARSLDAQETLRTLAQVIVPSIADWCRIDLLDDAGVLQRGLAHHHDPERARAALELARGLRAQPQTTGSMAWVVATGQSFYGDSLSPEQLADPAIARYTQAFGMHAHLTIPLIARGRTLGALAVLQAESGRGIGPEDRELVHEIGRRAALALDNARLFAQAQAARQEAESANRAKDEFLAMLGHELRNPLAPITTALALMDRREPDAAVQERRVIGRQVTHLSRLIDDLLDISRITQGKVELRREPLDLRAVAAQALEMTRPLFEPPRAGVVVDLPEKPVALIGDAVRLSQVAANLLINAAKFTPAGGEVRLSVAVEGGMACLRVSDTGAGIAPELLPQVFHQFVQGPQAIDRPSGGLGLGLAIARSLVERHGGSIEAHSEGTGRGAVFTVRLPLAASATVPPIGTLPAASGAAGAPAAVPPARILVVDDNADAAQTLSELLQASGYACDTAASASAGLAALAQARPQLALLDIGLPDMDGYALARRMRQQAGGESIRLVALTGYGQASDRARALEAGFDEHLVKPASLDRLLGLLEQLLTPPPQDGPGRRAHRLSA